MNLPMEVLLVVGVFALYLQDSALLLHYDEIALERGATRWHASTGGPLEFRDRRLYLPDPLRPTQPIFRVSWLRGADGERSRSNVMHFVAALGVLRGGCRCLWALLMVVLPALLWAYPHPLAMLALVAAVYATSAWLAWCVWRHRRAFELADRAALAMGFELLCCPPHAINLVRRLSLRRGLHGDAIDAVRRWLRDDDARQMRERIRERLAYAMDFHGEQAALVQARRRLEDVQ